MLRFMSLFSCPLGIISRMLSIITDTTPNLAGKIFLKITQKNQTAKNLVKWEFILSKNNCLYVIVNCMLIIQSRGVALKKTLIN